MRIESKYESLHFSCIIKANLVRQLLQHNKSWQVDMQEAYRQVSLAASLASYLGMH